MSSSVYIERQTSRGYLSLKEIEREISKGEEVYIATDSGRKKIKRVRYVGNQKTKVIKLSDGYSIEVTENHLFKKMTVKGLTWVRADNLTVGDYILRSTLPCEFPEESLFPEYSKYAYALGYYLRKGSIDPNSRTIDIHISELNHETESFPYLLSQFQDIFSKENVVVLDKYSKRKKTHFYILRSFYGDKDISLFSLCDDPIYKKKIPDFIRYFSRQDILLFLSGVFDASASIVQELKNRQKNSIFVTLYIPYRSLSYMNSLHRIFFNLGMRFYTRISKDAQRNQYALSCYEFYSIRKIYEQLSMKTSYNNIRMKDFMDCVMYFKNYNSRMLSSFINSIDPIFREFCKTKGCVYKVLNLGGPKIKKKKKNPDILTSLGKLIYVCEDLGFSLSEAPDLAYLYKLKCYSSKIISIEDSENECGDIEIEDGNTYISDGLIQYT